MDPENLEARVTALESQVRSLDARMRSTEQDAAAARVLAGAADRDVAEIRGEILDFRRATTASFNAVREDINDLRKRFDGVDRGFAEMRGRLDGAAAGQQQVVELIQTVIDNQGRGQQP